MIFPSIAQAGLDQLAAQASPPDSRRNASMCKDDDFTLEHVIEHSGVLFDYKFEAMLFWVMNNFNVFGFQRFIFIPMSLCGYYSSTG